jgi:hypothetical protein
MQEFDIAARITWFTDHISPAIDRTKSLPRIACEPIVRKSRETKLHIIARI